MSNLPDRHQQIITAHAEAALGMILAIVAIGLWFLRQKETRTILLSTLAWVATAAKWICRYSGRAAADKPSAASPSIS